MPDIDPSSELIVLGTTNDGQRFRPSDWCERLAGVMSRFRPGGAGPASYLNYSPWCTPSQYEGVGCVVVHPALREAEPMAWDFVVNFAKDNNLKVLHGAPLPPR